MAKEGVFYSFSGTNCIIRLIGEMKYTTVAVDFGRFIDTLLEKEDITSVVVDMRECTYIDSTDLGILARIAITMQGRQAQKPVIVYDTEGVVAKSVQDIGLGFLFTLVTSYDLENMSFEQVTTGQQTDELLLAKLMVSAHQNLVDIDETNKEKFASVISLMESEIAAMEKP